MAAEHRSGRRLGKRYRSGDKIRHHSSDYIIESKRSGVHPNMLLSRKCHHILSMSCYGKNHDSIFSALNHHKYITDNNRVISICNKQEIYREKTHGFRSTRSCAIYIINNLKFNSIFHKFNNENNIIIKLIKFFILLIHNVIKILGYFIKHLSIDSRRIFDITVALVALVATFPILLLACISMALTMHRKVFFLQQRYGHGGRRFTLIKLRSLKDVENHDKFGHPQQRLTPVARVIRRFGVDELPQFINVLNGDMSIFGPRPFDIEPNISRWKLRYAIKPGLIGLASVREKISGFESSLEKVVDDDIEYVSRRTWKIDAWLLIMAIACILTGRIDPQEQRVSNNRVYNALNRIALSTID